MQFTKDTSLAEINIFPAFSAVKDRLIGGGAAWFSGEAGQDTLSDVQAKHPTWNAEDILYGLTNLQRIAETGKPYVFLPNESHPQVSLLYISAAMRTQKSFVLLCGGGAYGAVCTMVESLPVAAWFNTCGYDCFCLNYRTATPDSFVAGLMPKPLEDVADALRFIRMREASFGLSAEEYFLGGFSAGGHLAALWGTAHLGARQYGLPAPQGLLLAYPLISLSTLPPNVRDFLASGLFGAGNQKTTVPHYEIIDQIDPDYPKTYLVQCVDDDTVPPVNADLMESALKKAGIAHRIERFPHGGHGFGLGSKAPGTQWLEAATEFLQEE